MAVFAASDQRCAKYIVATVYDQTRACPQLEDSQDYSGVIHGMSADSELTDAPLRPTRRSMGQDQGGIARPGGTCWGHRQGQPLFVEAVLYRYRAGIPWRDLPERFGDPIKIHMRFSRWAKSGVWKRMFEMLAADADNEYAMIDSTIVRAHQHSAGAQKKTAKTRRSAAAKAG